MLKIKNIPCFLLFTIILVSCTQKKTNTLRVLQFNIWQEGTVIPGGFDAVIDEILHTKADLIALSEVRNYNDKSLSKRLVDTLATKGYTYYSIRSQDTGILSRYPIVSQTSLYPVKDDQGSVTKAILQVKKDQIVFYSAHLDYRHCSLYLSRGYDGSTWEKLPKIVTDTTVIAADNLASKRDEAIDAVIGDSNKERAKGNIVILGGDFNEPSYLDWTSATKNMRDHHGVTMRWRNTWVLHKAGFLDTFRKMYPDPVTYPGFTFPADNPNAPINKLAWAPDADDRDRIDFIFYIPSKKLKLQKVKIIGPQGSIVRDHRKPDTSEDKIETPPGIWPTDHKAVLATFEINSGKN